MKEITGGFILLALLCAALPAPAQNWYQQANNTAVASTTRVAIVVKPMPSGMAISLKDWTPDQKAMAYTSMLYSGVSGKASPSPAAGRQFAAKAIGALAPSIVSPTVYGLAMLQLMAAVGNDPDPETRVLAMMSLYLSFKANPSRVIAVNLPGVTMSKPVSQVVYSLLMEVVSATNGKTLNGETPYFLGMRKMAASLMADLKSPTLLETSLASIIGTHQGGSSFFTDDETSFWTRDAAIDHYKMEAYILDLLGYMAKNGNNDALARLKKYAAMYSRSCSLSTGYMTSSTYGQYNQNVVAHARLALARNNLLWYAQMDPQTHVVGSASCLVPIINDDNTFACGTRKEASDLYYTYVPDMVYDADGPKPAAITVGADCSKEAIIFITVEVAKIYIGGEFLEGVFAVGSHFIFSGLSQVAGPATVSVLEKVSEGSFEAWHMQHEIKEYSNAVLEAGEIMNGKPGKEE
jgi:hypothetical protein